MSEPSQAEVDAAAVKAREKQAREANIFLPLVWPHDENGKPMAIVVGQASDLVKTVEFSNVQFGPCAIYRPVPNHEDIDLLAMEARLVQMMAQYIVGSERRLFQWAKDPSTKIEKPSELVSASSGLSFSEFVAKKTGGS